jgi:hypothetical protein
MKTPQGYPCPSLLNGVPDNNDTASTIEEAFEHYLNIIENHQNHLRQAEICGHCEYSLSPPHELLEDVKKSHLLSE